MDDVKTLLTYSLFGDYQRERHLSRMQQLRNETAAFHMLKTATTLQGGATTNELKGAAPFIFKNASRGMATMVTGGTPFAPVKVYTPATVEPVKPAPKRRGRGRSRR